jgi:hypothetical protein
VAGAAATWQCPSGGLHCRAPAELTATTFPTVLCDKVLSMSVSLRGPLQVLPCIGQLSLQECDKLPGKTVQQLTDAALVCFGEAEELINS